MVDSRNALGSTFDSCLEEMMRSGYCGGDA